MRITWLVIFREPRIYAVCNRDRCIVALIATTRRKQVDSRLRISHSLFADVIHGGIAGWMGTSRISPHLARSYLKAPHMHAASVNMNSFLLTLPGFTYLSTAPPVSPAASGGPDSDWGCVRTHTRMQARAYARTHACACAPAVIRA